MCKNNFRCHPGHLCGCLLLQSVSVLIHLQVEVVSDLKVLEKDYPCLAAVNRCANSRTTHFVFITY